MKAKILKIKNIGMIADEIIELNLPLLVFYGQIKQGKTTILNCVRWVCGGEFPSDIISHGKDEGSIEIEFDSGVISRSFYRSAKGGETKARPVVFVKDGKPVASPVTEIKRMLNPFLLNQDYLAQMSELERKRYFTDLFGVDTTDLDKELFNLESAASGLRSEIKGFGDIDLTKFETADVTALNTARTEILNKAKADREKLESELTAINSKFDADTEAWRKTVDEISGKNATVQRGEESFERVAGEIKELEAKLVELKAKQDATKKWLDANPKQLTPAKPAAPDTTKLKADILALHSPDTAAIDKHLSDASAQNVRAEQYQKNLERDKQRKAKQADLEAKEGTIRDKRKEKIARLTSINESCKIAGLKFGEDGSFEYEGTQAGMLSTSQIMKLSSELSALYPDGFGLELLDRGESLGKSIFLFVERANSEKKTILATVVGEKPANTPEDVGVFVVENGEIKK